MYSLDDTIAAIATPLGQGGIGIVRLSGPESWQIATRLFAPADSRALSEIEPNRLYYGRIVNPVSHRQVDEVLLSFMRAPRTYTRQDVVEINAHGGPIPLREILTLCLREGARAAHEGEFTLRAFLNGRLDLAQAEAVLDVICAKTEAALRVAVDQLGGRLSREVRAIRSALVETLAYLEATIDFADNEIPPHDIGPELATTERRLDDLLRSANRGVIYRQGIHTAIVGRPNVGKSSLLNVLLRADRAIVTPITGTTRDTLEETINLQGVPLVLVDTAGINESDDLVERLGVERSRRSVERADLVLWVVEGSEPLTEADAQGAALLDHKPTIVVINKSDLPAAPNIEADLARLLPPAPRVALSALTGMGVADLEALIQDMVFTGQVTTSDEQPVASNPRHRALFERALEHVRDAAAAWREDRPTELIAIDVTEAVNALGEITGETASEDLLDTIFSNFCIGK